MRYLIQDSTDPSWMLVNVDKLVTRKIDKLVTGKIEEHNHSNAELSALAEALLSIEGVVAVNLSPYKVWVQKATVYQWEELVADVLIVIKSVLSSHKDEVMYKAVPSNIKPSQVPIVEKEINTAIEKPPPEKDNPS